ncbi:hypothetical protein CTAYLR_001548 [Chrysophaeum taylorii]|uniref:Uncharacterized protein n=1 Tax=Chrysophaeum taylorii TaxID=2483200 RepID=A0AAD7XIK3_9STRA|nr:hypothetical protein CTAYLR_001548 [Chrysophaeum taylorii]
MLGWAVGRLMIFEALVLADRFGGTTALLLASLSLTTAEVAVEFAASALAPRVFGAIKREPPRTRSLSRFALEVYAVSAGVGLVAYPLVGLLVYGRPRAGFFALAVVQVVQYGFLNQIGDQAVELAQPHWLATFRGLDLTLFGKLRRPADDRSLAVYLSLLRVSLAISFAAVYVVLRSAPPLFRFGAVFVVCALTFLAAAALLRRDTTTRAIPDDAYDPPPRYAWPTRLDARLVLFSLCAFSLPEQALNALWALLVLRASTAAYAAVIVVASAFALFYFLRVLRNHHDHHCGSFGAWLRIVFASLAALVAATLLLFLARTSWLVFAVVPPVAAFAVAQQALRAEFTRFLFIFPEERSSAIAYWTNLAYVLASGPLLALNWILVQIADSASDYVKIAAVVAAAGGAYALASFAFACQPDLRRFEINEIGRTAFFVNELRILAAQRTSHKLLEDDAYAPLFSNDATRAMAGPIAERFPFFLLCVGAQKRYMDDRLRASIRAGATQLVILGSGLDARALHFPQIQTYEIDQENILEYKRKVLDDLPSKLLPVPYPPGYLGVDILGRLEETLGFDRTQPTVFLWAGNTMYLPNDATFACLRPLISDTSAAMVLVDTLSARLARPDGRVDTGDALLDACWQSVADVLGGGKNMFIGPWDVTTTAGDLGYTVQDSSDVLSVIEDVYMTSNVVTDIFKCDSEMAHVISEFTSQLRHRDLYEKPCRSRRTNAPSCPTTPFAVSF